MGDAGEGLVDSDSRIQERMDEVARERAAGRAAAARTPEQLRAIEALDSLKLARSELQSQLGLTSHAVRLAQLKHALDELDRRIADAQALIG
jgi:hypothetical protein